MNRSLHDFWNAFFVIFKIKKEIYKNDANNEQERQRREIESQILDEATICSIIPRGKKSKIIT